MGILLQLYIKNLLTCCGYCSPTEDRNAYQAVRSIQRSCRYLIQYPLVIPPQNHNHTNANTGNSFLTNLFGSNKDNGHTPTSSQQQRLTKPRRVRMIVQDSDVDGQPILCIIPLQNSNPRNPSTNTCADTSSHIDSTTTTIKLRRIDKVQLDGDQIVLYGKTKQPQPQQQQQRKNHPSTSTAVELLRFSIVLHQLDDDNNDDDDALNEDGERTDTAPTGSNSNSSSNDTVLVSTDTRNTMVHYWMVLVEWERQRRLKLKTKATNKSTTNTATNVDDADSDSEETDDIHNNNKNSNSNFITRHTQKIQHYAQREIELQRTKRQREVRKAQLLSQTNGGLKYTALAMATNQQQQQQQLPSPK